MLNFLAAFREGQAQLRVLVFVLPDLLLLSLDRYITRIRLRDSLVLLRGLHGVEPKLFGALPQVHVIGDDDDALVCLSLGDEHRTEELIVWCIPLKIVLAQQLPRWWTAVFAGNTEPPLDLQSPLKS